MYNFVFFLKYCEALSTEKYKRYINILLFIIYRVSEVINLFALVLQSSALSLI